MKIAADSSPYNVTGITADDYGYITVTQGEGNTVYSPKGVVVSTGGGPSFILDSLVAASTGNGTLQ